MQDLDRMTENAEKASTFLKSLSNRNRLIILCNLAKGECSVSELESILKIRQPTLSQQLAVLRDKDLVATRRDGKTIYYSLASEKVSAVISLLYDLFCEDRKGDAGA